MTAIVGLTEEQQCAIVDWAEATPCIGEVRIFGSRLTGTHRPDSDVDIAVKIIEGKKVATPFRLYARYLPDWRTNLSERIGIPAQG